MGLYVAYITRLLTSGRRLLIPQLWLSTLSHVFVYGVYPPPASTRMRRPQLTDIRFGYGEARDD